MLLLPSDTASVEVEDICIARLASTILHTTLILGEGSSTVNNHKVLPICAVTVTVSQGTKPNAC